MNKEQINILSKIYHEGLTYWLTNYFDYEETKKAFGTDIADQFQKATSILNNLEDWYEEQYDKYINQEEDHT